MAHLECEHGGAPTYRIVPDAGEKPQDPAAGQLIAALFVTSTGHVTISPMILPPGTREERLRSLEGLVRALVNGTLDFARQHPERLGL